MLTQDRGHAEFWDYLIGFGAAWLCAFGLSRMPLTHEYDEYPRGRIVDDQPAQTFYLRRPPTAPTTIPSDNQAQLRTR